MVSVFLADGFEQAGFATAVLKEIADRYKAKYHDDTDIVLSHEHRVNPQAYSDSRYIRGGITKREAFIYVLH